MSGVSMADLIAISRTMWSMTLRRRGEREVRMMNRRRGWEEEKNRIVMAFWWLVNHLVTMP